MSLGRVCRRYASILWRLLRPQTYALFLIYIGFAYSVSAYVLGLPLHSVLILHGLEIFILSIAIGCWYVSGTGINDYADYKVDQINLAHDSGRPLMQKLITRPQLLHLSLVSAGVGLLLILTLRDFRIVALFLIVTLLNAAYSIPPLHISHRGILAPLLLPIGYIVLPVYGVFLICNVEQNPKVLLALAGLYLHFFARILLKDFRDVRGDKKYGKNTVLLQLGQKTVCYLAIAAFLLSSGLLFFGLEMAQVMYVLAVGVGYGLFMLITLVNLPDWQHQSIAIAMFGRICTMIICLSMFTVAAHSEGLTPLRIQIVNTCIATVFLLSVSDFAQRKTQK